MTGRTGGIAADPYVTKSGTLHVAWQDYVHLTIADASSTDGGQTFSRPHVITLVSAFQLNIPAQAVRGALLYPSCDSFGTARGRPDEGEHALHACPLDRRRRDVHRLARRERANRRELLQAEREPRQPVR
jgi:hypothetical protein